MPKLPTGSQLWRDDRQRGAAAVEFALIVPLLLSLVLGVVDFGIAFGQNISIQGAAREAARQGVTQGDVITSAKQARGSLDNTKLQVKFTVDTTAGPPASWLSVCATPSLPSQDSSPGHSMVSSKPKPS